MNTLFFWVILAYLHVIGSFYFKQHSFLKHLQNNHDVHQRNTIVYAKKKNSLVSDEMLQQLEEHLAKMKEEEQAENAEDSKHKKPEKEEKKNKDKKKNKQKGNHPSPESEEAVMSPVNKEKESIVDDSKSKQDNKAKNKSKFAARAKFSPLTQPSFVSVGINEVEIVFANNRILHNASFAVATGDRVGLVGPNGSGKVNKSKFALQN
jgi:ATPase subunit of ABC transporter with duplicated ATPase domains